MKLMEMQNVKDVILVVDDQPNNLKVIASVLGDQYAISIANNGINALRMLENLMPDLILLDIMMPEMDGYEACRRIKENEKTKHIPVIFLTAKTDINDIIKGFEVGGIDYITKPFNPMEVKVRVRNHLNLHHANLALQNRERILQAITRASETFLKKSDWEKEIVLVLDQLKQALVVSRVTIFQNSVSEEGEMLLNLRFVSTLSASEDSQAFVNGLQAVSYEKNGLHNWQTEMANNRAVYGNKSEVEEEAVYFEMLKSKSILMVPIFVDQLFWGFMGFDCRAMERTWSRQEVDAISLIGNITGAAIKRTNVENRLSRLNNSLLNELELASVVQQYILPDWLKIEKEMIFSSIYKPSQKIGGDLFDYIKLSETHYVTYVGDVSGHGVQAALVMTAVKTIINMLINSEREKFEPYHIIDRLNKILTEGLFHNNYLTMILCCIDLEKGELTYFNAGHPPLIEYDVKSRKTRVLNEDSSIPVGWLPGYEFSRDDQVKMVFEKNKIYLLYTDGIFECENREGEQLGISGLTAFIEEGANLSYSILLPHIFKQKLTDLDYDINPDDFTLISFARAEDITTEKYRRIFYLEAKLRNTGPVGAECAELVNSVFDDESLAAKVEIIVNEYLNNIIEHGLMLKKEAIIAMEMDLKECITLRFWDMGVDWDLPEKKEDDEIGKDGKFTGLGMKIILSQARSINKNRYSEVNETVIVI